MTIIISTHRLSLLNMVDRLLLFDNGRLVADGPRDKVLAILQAKPVAPVPALLQDDAIQPKPKSA
jgi:ATP-binding cassette subfamily C protein LapB